MKKPSTKNPSRILQTPEHPEIEHGVVISRQDFHLLQEAKEQNADRGYRNLFAGIAASGSFALLGSLLSLFNGRSNSPLESVFLTLIAAGTIATASLAIIFHLKARNAKLRKSYQELIDRIRKQLRPPG